MIQIRYAEPYDLEVSGKVDELHAVGKAILDLVQSEIKSLVIEAETNFDPTPYEEVISQLLISKSNGPVRVTITKDSKMQVEASPEGLEGFSSFFTIFQADAKPGNHSHHEYWEGNEYIAPDSIPLVIRVN